MFLQVVIIASFFKDGLGFLNFVLSSKCSYYVATQHVCKISPIIGKSFRSGMLYWLDFGNLL